MSESTISAGPPSTALIASAACGSRKSHCTTSTTACGPIWPAPRGGRAWSRRPRLACPDAVLAHHLHQHSLAQPAVGDAQPAARERAADGVENGATGEHEIGAFGTDAAVGNAVFVAPAQQAVDHPGYLIVDHPTAVDAAALVARQFEMDAGYR